MSEVEHIRDIKNIENVKDLLEYFRLLNDFRGHHLQASSGVHFLVEKSIQAVIERINYDLDILQGKVDPTEFLNDGELEKHNSIDINEFVDSIQQNIESIEKKTSESRFINEEELKRLMKEYGNTGYIVK